MITINLYDSEVDLVQLSLALLRESTHKRDRQRAAAINELEQRIERSIECAIENGDHA